MNRIKLILGSVLFVAICGVFTVSAQTAKRHAPKPLATPLPTLTGAEIISRAGEYEDPAAASTTAKPPQKSPSVTSTKIKDLSERVDKLETTNKKEDAEAKQRR